MHKLLSTSTAARPTGSPPQRRLFRVPGGIHKGRLAALYADSDHSIKLTWSDYPYTVWPAAQAIASDSHDSPFSACMDSAGNIYLAYTDTGQVLKMIKLSFAGGVWSAGAAVEVINVDNTHRPFILKDGDGKLWCLFDHHRVSLDYRHYVRVKSSTDDGQTWGSGPADLGMQLSLAWVEPAYVSACLNFNKIYAVFCVGRSNLNMRICDLSGPTWGSESGIVSMDYIDDAFDIAPSHDGRIGLALALSAGSLYFKEYDDIAWSGLIEVDDGSGKSPQIVYQDNLPHIFYARHLGNNYYAPRHALKSGAEFALAIYSPYLGTFDKVLVYFSAGSTQFQDKTAAAGNVTAGDVFHYESQGLLDSVGDCVYFGRASRFFSIAVVLSTAGIGGSVIWEYFNGSAWVEFTPYSGAFDFDANDSLVLLWQDAASIPADWQLVAVDGYSAFWVRARVASGYSVNPVGSQMTAASHYSDFALVR